jgi:hypothetical protein
LGIRQVHIFFYSKIKPFWKPLKIWNGDDWVNVGKARFKDKGKKLKVKRAEATSLWGFSIALYALPLPSQAV